VPVPVTVPATVFGSGSGSGSGSTSTSEIKSCTDLATALSQMAVTSPRKAMDAGTQAWGRTAATKLGARF